MNNLSILIYLAEVSGRLNGALIFLLVAICTVTLVIQVARTINHVDNDDSYTKQRHPEKYDAARKFFEEKGYIPDRRLIILVALMLFAAVAIPSRQTIYMIAGSEIGEPAINSEEARDIYDDIRNVIRSYARPEEKAK